MVSLWRNDDSRSLHDRAQHLLKKTYPRLRWIWGVGDCDQDDQTPDMLVDIAGQFTDENIDIVDVSTGIEDRMQRFSTAVSLALNYVESTDDFVLIHESDIVSPDDVVERLLATGKCPVAGWPILDRGNNNVVFYDIWAYRQGVNNFRPHPPYCEGYDEFEPFQVSSVGSVWMLHAEDIVDGGVRCYTEGAVELCQQLRDRGREIWVDPTLIVEQPPNLWSVQRFSPRWAT